MDKGKLATILKNTKTAIIKDPSKAKAVYRVRVESAGGVKSVVTAQSSNPMTFDEAAGPNLGLGCSLEHDGHEVGMVPGEMYLASIGSCLVTGIKVFADTKGLEIEKATVDVTGFADLKGVLGIDQSVRIGYEKVEYKVAILCDGELDKIEELIATADKYSPILDLARKGTDVVGSYYVNGKAMELTQNLT
ncbi:MAG TPA: OsmC family protein [Nitrospinota bacterium]|nr:OsmC family protein [Nitrospinota bacterium]